MKIQFKLAVYDGLFNRRMIEVKVGLCHKIRLLEDGYVLAYNSEVTGEIYIVKCDNCKRYFLDRMHGESQLRFDCPFCTRIEMVKRVHGIQ